MAHEELPSLMIVVSEHETLYGDSQALVEKLEEIGDVDLTYVVEPQCPHVWMLFMGILPEADRTAESIRQTVAQWWEMDGNVM